MISGSDTNLQILHRVNTQQCEEEEEEENKNDFKNFYGSAGGIENDQGNHHVPPAQVASQLLSSLSQGLELESDPDLRNLDNDDNANTCSSNENVDNALGEQIIRNKFYSYYNRSTNNNNSNECKLSFFFVLLVLTGVGNIVGVKMQAIAMHNYGIFLSLFSYLIYVPLCFAFIIPVARYNWFGTAITQEHLSLPKRPFAIMGLLDCVSAVMQTFASIYLPGSLLVLLPQASIPLSMLLSKHMLGEQYRSKQYIGAVIVFMGIILVLEPIATFRHEPEYLCEALDIENHCLSCSSANSEETCLRIAGETVSEVSYYGNFDQSTTALSMAVPSYNYSSLSNYSLFVEPARSMLLMYQDKELSVRDSDDVSICHWVSLAEASTGTGFSVLIWSVVMVLSCVPMTLSSIYKQVKLRAHGDLHPVFLIGWIGLFQFLFTIISAPSLGWATGIPLSGLPLNIWNGLKCYFGKATVDYGCHPDLHCESGHAFLFVNFCLLCQAIYMLSVIFVLKYGSTSLLFLAMTLMVPLGHLIFSLWGTLYVSDVIALLVIVCGLLLYRFGNHLPSNSILEADSQHLESDVDDVDEAAGETRHPLLEPLLSYAYV